jgi:hypothetical protein
MALLAGLGVWQIKQSLKKKYLKVALGTIMIFLLMNIGVLIRLHPYENAYFNFLIGNLRGARDKNFPAWGNTFGTVYKEGIDWINKNVPENSKLTLLQNIDTYLFYEKLRPDIDYGKRNWSGIDRGGEYIIELVFNDTAKSSYYGWEYVETFLEPVYEYKRDGVTLLTIWKNDLEHTKKFEKLGEKELFFGSNLEKSENLLIYDLGKDYWLSRIVLEFDATESCFPITNSYLESSLDKVNWGREKDWIPYSQMYDKENLQKAGDNLYKIEFMLPKRKARYVRFWLDNKYSCGLNAKDIRVYYLG